MTVLKGPTGTLITSKEDLIPYLLVSPIERMPDYLALRRLVRVRFRNEGKSSTYFFTVEGVYPRNPWEEAAKSYVKAFNIRRLGEDGPVVILIYPRLSPTFEELLEFMWDLFFKRKGNITSTLISPLEDK